jgi:hypothetical protein
MTKDEATERSALKLALEAMQRIQVADMDCDFLNISQTDQLDKAINAVRKALASPPAQRTWVGLTDEEITDMWAESSPYYHEDDFAKAIEAKLKEKNT